MQLISHSVQRWFDHATDFTFFFYRLMGGLRQAFKGSRFVFHATGKLRRFVLVHFRKEYVKRQLFARKGNCHQCGTCCNFLFTCPMITKQGRCLIYGFCRPQACKVFPIDQRDLDEVILYGGQCGYRFNRPYIENTDQE
jgi:hypothetical protein